MTEVKKHIVVIGGGPGGYVAAIRAAQLGVQVTLVEKDRLGGTCLNRGCVPTKALLQSARLLSLAKEGRTFGLSMGEVSLDFSAVMRRKEAVVEQLAHGIHFLMKKNRIRVINGVGTIVDPKTVRIRGSAEAIRADSIVIATGSKPSAGSIRGASEPGVMSSDDVLALEQLPQSILVVGGGAIGLEFAQILGKMGVRVVLVERMSQILPSEDTEVAQMLEGILREDGIEIFTSATALEIKSVGRGQETVSFITKEGSKEIRTVEKVLLAVGRCPYTGELDIDKLGLALDKEGRIAVNERMETSIPGIYAAGDVVGGPMLAHMAMAGGKCAAERIAGADSKIDYQAVPRCVYTFPEVADVGLTEAQANEEYGSVQVGRFPFVANGRALTLNETRGMAKIIVDSKHGQILGVHILGSGATELIAEAVLAMKLEATFHDIASSLHAHPTLSETLMEAALDVRGGAIHH